MARRGIYKQKGSKNWWLRYAGLDGRIVYESSGSPKFSDAENLLIQRKQSIREGKQPEMKTIRRYTFQELVQQYLAWTNGRQRSAKTRGYIAGQLLERFRNLPLRSFNTMLVEQLQTELMERKLKNSSCNTVIGVLKRMFTKAVEWEMVEEDMLKRIRKVNFSLITFYKNSVLIGN